MGVPLAYRQSLMYDNALTPRILCFTPPTSLPPSSPHGRCRDVWVMTLAQHAAAAARLRRPPLLLWPRVRGFFAALHGDPVAQYSWGMVVLASFAINCVQVRVSPPARSSRGPACCLAPRAAAHCPPPR